MTVVFTDNFTGVSGTAIAGRAGTGGSWTGFGVAAADIAALKINATNQVRITSTTGCLVRVELGEADHYAKAAILVANVSGAVAVRATDHLNLVGLRVAGSTQVELFKRVAGTETSVTKVSVGTVALPITLELRMSGSTAFLVVNGASVGLAAGYAVADAALTGVTKAGLWGKAGAVNPLADDFEAGTLASAPMVALAVAGGRSASRGGDGAVSAPVALAPTRARSETIDRGASVALVLALLPAGGRSMSRGAGSTLGVTTRLAPVFGRSLGRAGTPLLVPPLVIAAASARMTMRAGAGQVSGARLLVPDASRLASRGRAARLFVFRAGMMSVVGDDARVVAVRHD